MRAFLVLAMFLALVVNASSTRAQSGGGQVDRSVWGVLADLAERDFVGNVTSSERWSNVIFFRWRKKGEVLQIERSLQGDGRSTFTIMRQPDGNLKAVGGGSFSKWTDAEVTLENDRSAVFKFDRTKSEILEKIEIRLVQRFELVDGRLSHTLGDHLVADRNRYLLIPTDQASDKKKLYAEERRVQLGLTVAEPSTQVADLRPLQTTAAAAQTSIVMPPQPSTDIGAVGSSVSITPSNGKRIALVVGNAGYGATLGSLANPIRDATAIANALRALGFDVEVVIDADQRAMKRAIIRLGQRLTEAGRGTTGLFYFAGHGMQSRGTNFLVPVGAAIDREADVDVEAVAADSVLRQLEDAGTGTSIVILDACRNLPVQRSFRDGSRGLARMNAPNGSFVAYSTAPGEVAADGSGANSPFATALIAEMAKPGQPIEAVFRNVRRAVSIATNGTQTPWDSSSLFDSFVFNLR